MTVLRKILRLFGWKGVDASAVFCVSAAALLAKLAKADGRVTANEIEGIEFAFKRLGFSPATREQAIAKFREAKDDEVSIDHYAHKFVKAVRSISICELFYEILWDIAAADGNVSKNELIILQRIPRMLKIRIEWYGYFYKQHFGKAQLGKSFASSVDVSYAILGADKNDDFDTLQCKYRELAKQNHPDRLRAQGLPEELIGKATERMSRINNAWRCIRSQFE